jgi:hypothetical protein
MDLAGRRTQPELTDKRLPELCDGDEGFLP